MKDGYTGGDRARAAADLVNHIALLVDMLNVAERHRDGSIHLDPRALAWHVSRIEREALHVVQVGLCGNECTPYVPVCMGRAAGAGCTCNEIVPPIRTTITRRACAKLAPSRKTGTGRLLVQVPDDFGSAP